MNVINIFNLTTPEAYRCNVLRYSSQLSRLYLRLFKAGSADPMSYILFTDVGYFEGPMNWQSADFSIARSEDCLTLMASAGLVENIMLDDPDTRQALAEAANLYLVTSPHSTVRIIAGSAILLDTLPDDSGFR